MDHIVFWIAASIVAGAMTGMAMRTGGLKRRGSSIVIDIVLGTIGGVAGGLSTVYVKDLRDIIIKNGLMGTVMEFAIVLSVAMMLVVIYDALNRKQNPLFK